MGKCVVKSCSSRTDTHYKSLGISFHTIPNNPVREMWVKNIRLLRKETDWIPTKASVICSKHFREKDKVLPKRDGGSRRLTEEAVPVADDDDDEPDDPGSPKEILEDVGFLTDEEIHEVLETAREHKMRLRIQRLEKISAKRFKKIRMLSQKNRRLKAKTVKLANLVKELKKRCACTYILSVEEESNIDVSDGDDVDEAT